MTSVGMSLVILVVVALLAFAVGRSGRKPAPTPAPQPKIFGLGEFESFVGAIPASAKADPATMNVVVQAGTGLAVGLLGFEDRVVPEVEQAIVKKTGAIQKNNERVVSLQEEISEIQTEISETNQESEAAQTRISTLASLRALKAS